jgi:polyisoprenoid-binding protein YceI
MSQVALHPFTGTFRAEPVPSTFAFAVCHSETFTFRGVLPEVAATLRADGDDLALEGAARVASISVVEPEAMRASLLGPEFFDAENHPEVAFRSTEIRLADDCAEIEGELTMKGTTHTVSASGHFSPPRQAAFGEIAGLQLSTTIDRRDFGFDWQMEMPEGGVAVGWEVEIDIDLLLMRADPPAAHEGS